MKTLKTQPDYCIGCHLCVLACSFYHHNVFSEAMARLKVLGDETIWKFEPAVCRQCSDTPCAAACPTGAITQHQEIGSLSLDASSCVGCRACIEACPYQCIVFNPDTNLVQLCDLCNGSPQCVADCPHGAIVYE